MSAQPVEGIPSFVDAYIRHGWKLCDVPAGTKGPQTPGWNKVENALPLGAQSEGVGLLHSYSGTCALDLDDLDLATAWLAERGIALSDLANAPDAVAINSGNPGHGKLIYALPFALPSKRVTVGGKVALEFRCATAGGLSVQDVLPPSRHPSGTVYRWTGAGNWQNLPLLPEGLMTAWQELITKETEHTVKTGDGSSPASIEEIRSALVAINPGCDRKTWIEVGMALATVGPELFPIWDEWSQGSPEKYPGQREAAKQWASFRPLPAGITVASLFHHAYAAGWQRPVPKDMFGPVQAAAPEEVIEKLSPTAAIPTVDLSLWPPVLARRALEIAKEVGCDPVVPLVAGLVAVSGALDKRTALQITPTWRVPPTFWAMTIGEPADKKTPGSKPMFNPLRKLEIEDRDRYQVEMLQWQGKEARHAAQYKAFREWQADPSSEMPNAVPPVVEGLPPQPLPLRLLINDATTQKVVSMAENRPRGFLLYMDEMNRWLTKLSDPRTTDDRGAWIQGYETGSYAMDRMGAGSIQVENLAMSLYGNCQPTVFRKNVEGTSSDGIIQRFMPVVLNPSANAMWEDGVPAFMSSEHDYEQLVRRTFALQPFDYVFSPAANEVFRRFCAWALRLRENERIVSASTAYQTALGKMEGNCARLILLFHVMSEPYSMFIDEEIVLRATTVFKTFFAPSLRYTFLEVGQQSDPVARHIFDLITQWASSKPTVIMSDLRKVAKQSSDAPPWQHDQLLRVVMDDLAGMGYVALLQDHPRHPVWTINPAVAQLFADYRRRIILAKQELLEAMEDRYSRHHGQEIKFGRTATGYETL
jgi:hypothetical protein